MQQKFSLSAGRKEHAVLLAAGRRRLGIGDACIPGEPCKEPAMRVEELMTMSPTTVSSQDTLDVAAQKLWDSDCGVLPVVGGDGRIIGIVTDRDICMSAWSKGRLLSTIHVDEAMSKEVFSVKPDQDVDRAEQLMAEKQVRRLPVVDAENKPIGILSMNDIAREAARPGSKLRDGITHAIQTIATICRPRKRSQRAA